MADASGQDKSQCLDFTDLTIIEVTVKFPNKTYTLREASGDIAVSYRNRAMACSKFNENGKIAGIEGMADLEPYLVHCCLSDEEGKRVPEEMIRAWPSRYLKELFNKVKEISGLDEDSEETLLKQKESVDKKLAALMARKEQLKN